MTRRSLWLALLLVPAGSGLAHGQAIVGPTGPVPPYRLARVTVEGADSVAFDTTPLSGSEDYDGQASGSTYLLAGAPGRYKVLAFAVKDNKPAILSLIVVFAGSTPAPTPTPGPTPTPTPPARTELQRVGIEYAYAVPAAAKRVAGRVSAGEFGTVAEAMAEIEAARNRSRSKLADAIAAGMEGAYDPATGAITDKARVAAVMADLGGLAP